MGEHTAAACLPPPRPISPSLSKLYFRLQGRRGEQDGPIGHQYLKPPKLTFFFDNNHKFRKFSAPVKKTLGVTEDANTKITFTYTLTSVTSSRRRTLLATVTHTTTVAYELSFTAATVGESEKLAEVVVSTIVAGNGTVATQMVKALKAADSTAFANVAIVVAEPTFGECTQYRVGHGHVVCVVLTFVCLLLPPLRPTTQPL